MDTTLTIPIHIGDKVRINKGAPWLRVVGVCSQLAGAEPWEVVLVVNWSGEETIVLPVEVVSWRTTNKSRR